MSGPGSAFNVGELSRPVTVLIEKISDAIGGIFRPYQMKRIAQAESEAERIRVLTQIEMTDLRYRAIQRFVAEEAKKQANMEAIIDKAIPDIKDDAPTDKIEEDWLAHFLNNCRLVSDEEMQMLWGKVLAGEANCPHSYSKRAVTILSSLDKREAELFQELGSFSWMIKDSFELLIYDYDDPIYKDRGIRFDSLSHLDDIGLITYDVLSGFLIRELPKKIATFFCNYKVEVEFPKPEQNNLAIGHVMLTRAGRELAHLCTLSHKTEFRDYIINKWRSEGYVVEYHETQDEPNPFRCGKP